MHGYRVVTARDHSALFALHEAAHRPLVEAVYQPWDDDEQWQTFFRPMLTGFAVTAIEHEGRLVGAVYLDVTDDDFWLEMLQIHPDHQGHGLGTEALRWVVDRAASQQRATRLQVHRENVRAHALYEREGFLTVATTTTHRVMRRPLTP